MLAPGRVLASIQTAQTFAERNEQERGVQIPPLSIERNVRLSLSSVRTGLGTNTLTQGLA